MSKIKRKNRKAHTITIEAPLFYDRAIMLPVWEVQKQNKVLVDYHNYVRQFFISGADARKWPIHTMPTKKGITVDMYAIPRSELDELELKGTVMGNA